MEKIDLNIGDTFTTTDGDTYKALASPGTDCNACKGCDFRNVLAASEEENKDLYTCDAPENLQCCKPDRIFKKVEP